jgi:hypothetical protein
LPFGPSISIGHVSGSAPFKLLKRPHRNESVEMYWDSWGYIIYFSVLGPTKFRSKHALQNPVPTEYYAKRRFRPQSIAVLISIKLATNSRRVCFRCS